MWMPSFVVTKSSISTDSLLVMWMDVTMGLSTRFCAAPQRFD